MCWWTVRPSKTHILIPKKNKRGTKRTANILTAKTQKLSCPNHTTSKCTWDWTISNLTLETRTLNTTLYLSIAHPPPGILSPCFVLFCFPHSAGLKKNIKMDLNLLISLMTYECCRVDKAHPVMVGPASPLHWASGLELPISKASEQI